MSDVHAAREQHELERQLREARNAALEEAAAICDAVAVDGPIKIGGSASPWMKATAEDCALYIRRRKT